MDSDKSASDLRRAREQMVDLQLSRRDIVQPEVLEAFGAVPREDFVPAKLAGLAYEDGPLPIGDGQTISQPYIVALTVQAMQLEGGERVLEVGTGSGYAAAILGQIAREVFTVERIDELAQQAEERFERLGMDNIRVLASDGSVGWPEHAPYDAIAVAAGGPRIPEQLLGQLKIGGRLVMPVGTQVDQMLVRVVRVGESRFRREDLCPVRFVPLIGEGGWEAPRRRPVLPGSKAVRSAEELSTLVRENAEGFQELDSHAIDGLIERARNSRVVLLGESTHGTSEFYRMRAHITRKLIEDHGFDFVAVEADWPDAARVDAYARGREPGTRVEFTPFSRFPTWMWRNQEVATFIEWLREHNVGAGRLDERAGFHGLDLYSMFTSMAVVLSYLHDVDPEAEALAKARYGQLEPWQGDPAGYGRAVLMGAYKSSEEAIVQMLRDMLERRLEYARRDGARFFDAAQNARLVANAEAYYRSMYHGSAVSWNLRDSHMFETLQSLLTFYGPDSKAVIWEHNSHVGNARATEMSRRGEHNVGQLCREHFGDDAYIVGFSTDHGTVAAASSWDAPMQLKRVRPAHPRSYEYLCHGSELDAFTLHLREPRRMEVRSELEPERLERAIGVIYRPDTELQSHYFQASLPEQFDELVWFDETVAVHPLAPPAPRPVDLPETYPFGL